MDAKRAMATPVRIWEDCKERACEECPFRFRCDDMLPIEDADDNAPTENAEIFLPEQSANFRKNY